MALQKSMKNIETHKTMLTDLVANISNTTQERMAELQNVEQDVKLSVDNMKIQLDVWYEEYKSKIDIRRQELQEISKDALKKVTKCLNKLTMFESSLVNMEQGKIDIEDIEEFTNDHIQLAVGDVDALVEATQVENVNICFNPTEVVLSKSVVLGELDESTTTRQGAVGGVRSEAVAAIEDCPHKTFEISEFRRNEIFKDYHLMTALPNGNIMLDRDSVIDERLVKVDTDSIFVNMSTLSVVRLDYETDSLYAFCKDTDKISVHRFNLVTTAATAAAATAAAAGRQVYKCTGFVPTLPGINSIDACFITNNQLCIGCGDVLTYFKIKPLTAEADANTRFIEKQSKMTLTVDSKIRDVITTMNAEIILVCYNIIQNGSIEEAVLYHVTQDDAQLTVKHRMNLCEKGTYSFVRLFCPTSSYIIAFISLGNSKTQVCQTRVNTDGSLSDPSSIGEINVSMFRICRLKSDPNTICASDYNTKIVSYRVTESGALE
ncbi:uncharacterized protein LOC141908765 [Tubulanus polymorphus]|uniref:uncharacterized protein LOC141908765 n=1 Tax=Tubulanus polymorphus TaxID=672921 RepID=UPI003DA572D8